MRALAVTTINSPNDALRALAEGARVHNVYFVIVGDTKTPVDFKLPHANYLAVTEQLKRFPNFCDVLPTKHYARKNVGYLNAIAEGATEILETDDDNIPYPEFWYRFPESSSVDVIPVDPTCPWFNVYSQFTERRIWPRGYPLQYLQVSAARERQARAQLTSGMIVQGLANSNPDVDAVYRLTQDLPVNFRERPPLMLGAGVWCPFNSQNTLFRRPVFPLLYLPAHCSFRMTDIWRSFVAQRCLWELGEGVVFQSATVYQDRNEHDLLRDFADEVPGYLLNDRIRSVLESCSLERNDMLRSLSLCYESLIKESLIPGLELPVVRAWCAALDKLSR